MNCNCIETVESELQEHHNDDSASLSKLFYFGVNLSEMELFVTYTISKRDKKGNKTEKRDTRKLTLNYCPFC